MKNAKSIKNAKTQYLALTNACYTSSCNSNIFITEILQVSDINIAKSHALVNCFVEKKSEKIVKKSCKTAI
jgi:hypothetical protein